MQVSIIVNLLQLFLVQLLSFIKIYIPYIILLVFLSFFFLQLFRFIIIWLIFTSFLVYHLHLLLSPINYIIWLKPLGLWLGIIFIIIFAIVLITPFQNRIFKHFLSYFCRVSHPIFKFNIIKFYIFKAWNIITYKLLQFCII